MRGNLKTIQNRGKLIWRSNNKYSYRWSRNMKDGYLLRWKEEYEKWIKYSGNQLL